ncbi:hypothetical protein ACFFSY_20680 [Paenibacillus aurantiacus]|uniref:Myb-like domain-containing protein n=1 Tax=Paenibacillus aurantiacus TaxID=1936118 RepID=A0ABV5KVW4_9BACL
MKLNRKDQWTPEDDAILADIVLEYIREGRTQLGAFDAVGERLGRTSAACGFRWNSEVRKQYAEEIKQAKLARKQLNGRGRNTVLHFRQLLKTSAPALEPADDAPAGAFLAGIIQLAEQHQSQVSGLEQMIHALRAQLAERDSVIASLQERLNRVDNTLPSDTQTFLAILERARRLGVIDSTTEQSG